MGKLNSALTFGDGVGVAVEAFVQWTIDTVEARVLERLAGRLGVASDVTEPKPRAAKVATPPKAAAPVAAKPRAKRARQLCPVPRCTNTAAPVFNMVCAKHRDLPKATIKKFREQRRAKK